MKILKPFLCCILFLSFSDCYAQLGDKSIRIFGYFQNMFAHQTEQQNQQEQNSFNMQQLNLFFQTDVAKNWRAFVNFEFLNNFSSIRNWGAANLEEAWVRYRTSRQFSLKMGLLIPTFNHLNEIKNRTPILPYVIRPLVYETSFSEFIAVEEFAPARAFIQAYGFIPLENKKLDYAVYLGNSPNVSTVGQQVQSGLDTTATFLVGARVGLRINDLKFGISATRDNVNSLQEREISLQREVAPSKFLEIPRWRVGFDLGYHKSGWTFEGEFITVTHDDKAPQISIDKLFYYATLGYNIKDRLFVYASYWLTRQDFTVVFPIDGVPSVVIDEVDVRVPTVGFSYSLSDRITFKAQAARALIEEEIDAAALTIDDTFNHFSIAASVFF